MLIHNAEVTGSLNINNVPFNSGSFSGSFQGDGSQLTGITGATTASYVEYSNIANKPALVSGSEQISFNGIVDKPTLVSGSSQITYSGLSSIPSGIVSGSSQVSFNGITDKPTLVSGSSQITYSGLSGIPSGIVSGSSQVSFNGIVDKPTLVSGSSQVTYGGLSGIPAGIVSGSAQITGFGIFATTGSNTFQANQVITGSLFISQNLVVAGSSSIQYISSSVVDIADNIITVNAFNPGVRFGGLAVVDSGSSPQVSGSLLFDSIKDQWIFIHETPGTITSSVLLMGPETYNDLGNETYLSANRLPKGTGIEHLRDSNITDTGTIVSINSNTQVTGSLNVSGGVTGSFNGALSGNATTATTLQTARNIGGVSFNGSANIDLPGVNTTGNQDTSGNAATATSAATLTTTRTLWGQNFNGSGNVTGALSSVTTLSMNNQLTNTLATGTAPFAITSTTRVANLNVATAGTADTLTTARTIGGVSFNGSANIDLPGVNTAGNQDTSGNAATATSAATWTTGRTITIGSTGKSVNGSANVSWSLAEIGAQAALTNPVTGTGTSGQVAYFTGTSAISSESNLFWDASNNRLGINQSSPLAPLHVGSEASSDNANVQRWDYAGSTAYQLILKQTVTSGVVRWNFSQVNNSTAYDNVLVLDRGNVGMGTTTPSFTLDVNGNTRAERYRGINSLTLNTYTTVNPASNVFLYSQPNDRDAWIFLDSADTSSNWGIYHRQIDTTVSNLPANSLGFIGGGANTLQSYISLGNGNAYFRGSVGIGNTDPSSKLNVDGGDIKLNAGNASANYYLYLNRNSSQDGGILLQRGNANDWQITNGTSGNLWFYTYGAGITAVTFERSTGNVGIGTSSPSSKLSVCSTTACSTVVNVQGCAGQLFSVTDNLVGDIFSVSDISGIPILNVNSNGTVCVDSKIAVGANHTVSGNYASVTGGRCNTASGCQSTVSGGYCNTACSFRTNVAGGGFNTASAYYSSVGGGRQNCSSSSFSTVAGGFQNTASGYASVVAGGGGCSSGNSASGTGSTVGGGRSNTASGGNFPTVSGGCGNISSGCRAATVVGGQSNTASANYTVAGGAYNCASGAFSTVFGAFNTASGQGAVVIGGGGYFGGNTASGYCSAVLGGASNTADCACSAAANNSQTTSSTCQFRVNALSKASGTFRIDHPDPSKKYTHYLSHSFVESPTAGDNIYRYKVNVVNGQAVITLPSYYKYLNQNDQIWVTPQGHFGIGYGEINTEQTQVTIYGNADGEYNVLLIGTRKDHDATHHWQGVETYK